MLSTKKKPNKHTQTCTDTGTNHFMHESKQNNKTLQEELQSRTRNGLLKIRCTFTSAEGQKRFSKWGWKSTHFLSVASLPGPSRVYTEIFCLQKRWIMLSLISDNHLSVEEKADSLEKARLGSAGEASRFICIDPHTSTDHSKRTLTCVSSA